MRSMRSRSNAFLGVPEIELLKPELVPGLTGAPVGFVGPVGLKQVRIMGDWAVKAMANFVVGANQADTHFVDANWERDFKVDQFADLRNARAGDCSPRKDGTLKTAKGIEVGHVFMLGTKYSQAMKATFLDAQGQEQLAVMGCYGIGVSRTAAASVEQNHDAKGIKWPVPIAPFHVTLLAAQPVSTSHAVSRDPLSRHAGGRYRSTVGRPRRAGRGQVQRRRPDRRSLSFGHRGERAGARPGRAQTSSYRRDSKSRSRPGGLSCCPHSCKPLLAPFPDGSIVVTPPRTLTSCGHVLTRTRQNRFEKVSFACLDCALRYTDSHGRSPAFGSRSTPQSPSAQAFWRQLDAAQTPAAWSRRCDSQIRHRRKRQADQRTNPRRVRCRPDPPGSAP